MKSILIPVYLFISIALNGQFKATPQYLDSLKNLLSKTRVDTVRLDLLNQLGAANQYENVGESMKYMNEAVELSKKLDIPRQIGTLLSACFFYKNIGENPRSIELLHEVARKSKESNTEIHGMVEAFIGMNYQAMGDYSLALHFARLAYWKLENLSKETNTFIDERGYMAGPRELALCFEKLGQLDSALYYSRLGYQRTLHMGYLQENGLNHQKYFNDEYPIFYCQNTNMLGTVHLALNNIDSALHFFKLANNKAIITNFFESIAESQLSLARFYHQTNVQDSATHYALKSYEKATPLKNYILMREAAELLRAAYEKKGEYNKALYANDLAISAKDSVQNFQKQRQIQVLTLKEEQYEKELETERLVNKARNRQSLLIANLFFLICILFFQYWDMRVKKKLNAQLLIQKNKITELNSGLEQKIEERTFELKKALDEVQTAFDHGQNTERQRVSADLHDEVGSALSTIAIFSDIAKIKALKFAPELVAELDRIGVKSRDMIQTMRDTIWSLKDNNSQTVWERLYNTANENLKSKNIELIWNLPPENELPELSFNTKRNVFLAFKEAINNIIKHAEAIVVTVEGLDLKTKFELKIMDNGKGFDMDLIQKDGNGLQHFETRMSEIDGSLNIESNPQHGTCIAFTFPVIPTIRD